MENPFSFHKFVNEGKEVTDIFSDDGNVSEDEIDSYNEKSYNISGFDSSISSAVRTDNENESIMQQTDDDDICTSEEEEQNPFSFKSFLTSPAQPKPPRSLQLTIMREMQSVKNLKHELEKISDDDADGCDDDNNVDIHLTNDISSDEEFENNDDADDHPSEFSDDGYDVSIINGTLDEMYDQSPVIGKFVLPHSPAQNGKQELNNKIDELTSENVRLQDECKAMRQEFLRYRSSANKRISALQKELERSRKKELDETKALETIVRDVEQNLVTATARAVKAESVANRLREENALLRQESVPRPVHNRLLRENSHIMNAINAKSKDTAEHIRSAASKLEPQLRQMVAGLSSLHFLADQFEDIGKISDIPFEHLSDTEI